MEPYYQNTSATITIFHGDCRAILAQLEPDSVQCCVTSPPYWGLRDYGIPPSVWGGSPECEHEWGDSVAVSATNHVDKRRWNHARNGRGEDQPVEKLPGWKRQMIEQGQFCQLCGAWSGCLGLEPTPDLFVEHIVEVFEAVRRVLRPDGTLWVNLGDSFCSSPGNGRGANPERASLANGGKTPHRSAMDKTRCDGLKPKDLVGVPWLCAFALRSAGWWLRSEIIWHKPNPMPESVTDRPTKAHEQIFLFAKSAKYYYDADAIKEPANWASKMPDGWDTGEGGHGTIHRNGRQKGENIGASGDSRNRRSVWSIPTSPCPEAHFATFPPKLIEPCILAGCPEGGLVLDPFSGAGTTAMVCKELGRRFMGCELNPSYIEIAEKRIGKQEVLF